MFDEIEVVSITEGDYYNDSNVSGSTVDVTMRRGSDEFASCEGILIWEEDDGELNDTFDLWKTFAEAGEEGYKYWTE